MYVCLVEHIERACKQVVGKHMNIDYIDRAHTTERVGELMGITDKAQKSTPNQQNTPVDSCE